MISQEQQSFVLLPGRWRKLNCCLLVVTPVLLTLGLAVSMVCRAKYNLQESLDRQEGLIDRMHQVASLIVDLNNERELALLHAAARSPAQSRTLSSALLRCQLLTDESLASMTSWPATSGDPYILQSWHLFKEVLDTQRRKLRNNSYFWDEIKFYAEVIETLQLWLTREGSLALAGPELWQWAVSLAQLMTCINFLGVQQSLCSVFQSIVCFSHRETFIFANYSFSGEAAFEIYKSNYPANNNRLSFTNLFPGLLTCRQSVFAGLELIGFSGNELPCEVVSRNISLSHEVIRFGRIESTIIEEQMKKLSRKALEIDSDHLSRCALVLTAALVYIITVLFARTAIIMFLNKRAKHARFRLRRDPVELMENEEDHPRPPKSESRQRLCNQTVRHGAIRVVKVATV